MAQVNTGMIQAIHDKYGLEKPSTRGLLAHFMAALFSSETITLLVLGSALLTALRHYGIASGDGFALLAGSIVVWSFLRGCGAWQADLDSYQRALADARHTQARHLS